MNMHDDIPVFLLCGGLGTRLKEETEFRPKPMVMVGDQPILWHIMRWYRKYGFRRFVLCTGFKSEMIKSYFLDYSALNSDFTVDLRSNDVEVHSVDHDLDWRVTVAYTGETTMTGGRIARAAKKYLGDARHFAVTYADGLTDADLGAELEFHMQHGCIGTMLGVSPPSRFGEFAFDGDLITRFEEKPEHGNKWINGGYLFFRRDFIDYLAGGDDCVLEKTALSKLAADRQLQMYRHNGFWACMDTQRDKDYLEGLWRGGQAPWLA